MGIFTDIYNTVAKFFRQSDEPVMGEASKAVAANRLKLVLMQDRTNLTPKVLEQMRGEMIELLSKYLTEIVVLAWIIFIGIYMYTGVAPVNEQPVFVEIIENSAADKAGFKAGECLEADYLSHKHSRPAGCLFPILQSYGHVHQ